ncbi:hypothetical protein ID866_9274 [Astraeus odoratus]|nr:hypothetical protein ID866_9274 [Astraeus odoratus]
MRHVQIPPCIQVYLYAADVIFRVTYGKDTPTSNDDPEVQRIHIANENFRHVMKPGAFLVDRIPILEYIPGYGKQLNELHQFDHEIAFLAVVLFGAGAEATGIAIMNAILAAACHPEAQARVQKELDLVVGRDRTPSWEDASSLPQLNAFILEAARWKPVTPYGIGHRVSKDINWRG